MKILLALILASLFAAAPAAAQQAPLVLEQSPSEAVESTVTATLSELESLIESMYGELESLRERTSPGVYEVLAVGTGAGLGFLASGVLMTGLVGPMTQGLAHSMGLSEMAAALLTASVTTIGIVSGTYAGGVYARNLIVD